METKGLSLAKASVLVHESTVYQEVFRSGKQEGQNLVEIGNWS